MPEPELKLNTELMEREGFHFESPRDVLLYVNAGIVYLNGTANATDPETSTKRESWIRAIGDAMACIEF